MGIQQNVNQMLSAIGNTATIGKIVSTAAKEADLKAAQQKEKERKRLVDIEHFKHKIEVGEKELYATLTRKREKGEQNIGQKRAGQAEQIVSNYERLYEIDPSEINKMALEEAKTRSIAIASAIGKNYKSKAVKDLATQISKKYPELLKEQGGNK